MAEHTYAILSSTSWLGLFPSSSRACASGMMYFSQNTRTAFWNLRWFWTTQHQRSLSGLAPRLSARTSVKYGLLKPFASHDGSA